MAVRHGVPGAREPAGELFEPFVPQARPGFPDAVDVTTPLPRVPGPRVGAGPLSADERTTAAQDTTVLGVVAAAPPRTDGVRSAEEPADRSVEWQPLAPRLPWVLLAIDAVLVVLSIGLPNIAPDVEFLAAEASPARLFFGVSQEMNLPTFFSVMLLTATGLTLLFVGRLARGGIGTAFVVAAALVLLMGFDDFTALHERLNGIGGLVAPEGFSGAGYLWVIPASLVAVVLLVAFWRLAVKLRGRARLLVLLGIATVLFAAMGLETMNGYLDHPGTDGMPLQIGTHVEEFTENLGMILVLTGALSVLRRSSSAGAVALRVDPAALGRAA